MEDFVKIVKQAGSIKRAGTEKVWKIVKQATLFIGSQDYEKKIGPRLPHPLIDTQKYLLIIRSNFCYIWKLPIVVLYRKKILVNHLIPKSKTTKIFMNSEGFCVR